MIRVRVRGMRGSCAPKAWTTGRSRPNDGVRVKGLVGVRFTVLAPCNASNLEP